MTEPRHRLKARRESLNVTQEEMAHALGVAVSTYRAWEYGTSSPRADHRRKLVHHLKVPREQLGYYLSANGDAAMAPRGQTVVEWLTMYASFEQGAAELWAWEPVTVHALLQTPAYAAAVERTAVAPSEERAAQVIQVRMARQGALTREYNPLVLHVVLDESVIRRMTGGRQVMAEQLDHLAKRAERPNVTIQVLPLDPGIHAAGFGAFTVLTSAGVDEPRMACSTDRAGFKYHESQDAIDAHVALFEHLCDLALPPDESMSLIRAIAKETRQ